MTFVFLCALALTVQNVFGNCINPGYGSNLGIYSPSIVATPGGCGCGGVGVIDSGFGGSLGGCVGGSLGGTSFSNLASQLAASNGGNFVVTSSSPLAPSSLSIASDNLLLEGPVTVFGQVPFVSAVALEGLLSSGGSASAAYSCGNGEVGILNENSGAIGTGYNGIAAPGLSGCGSAGIISTGLPNGLYGAGLGCNNGFGGLKSYPTCGCI